MGKTAILNFNDDDFVGCTQGAEFAASFTWTGGDGNPINLSSYTADMQVRKVAGGDIITELSTTNSKITLSSEGVIALLIAYTETALFPAGTFVYDMRLVDGSGIPSVILRGSFVVTEAVTV